MIDPLLRFIIAYDGGYLLSGQGTGAYDKARWPRQKSEGH